MAIEREEDHSSETRILSQAITNLQTRLKDALRDRDHYMKLAHRDPVTGLGNRLMLDDELISEARRAGRFGQTFSIIVIDATGLKKINDDLGHDAGDDFLRAIANVVSNSIRDKIDSVYRVNGPGTLSDEFAVLLPNTPLNSAEILAKRIKDILLSKAEYNGGIKTHIGIANSKNVYNEFLNPSTYENANSRSLTNEELAVETLKHADTECNNAKRAYYELHPEQRR